MWARVIAAFIRFYSRFITIAECTEGAIAIHCKGLCTCVTRVYVMRACVHVHVHMHVHVCDVCICACALEWVRVLFLA